MRAAKPGQGDAPRSRATCIERRSVRLSGGLPPARERELTWSDRARLLHRSCCDGGPDAIPALAMLPVVAALTAMPARGQAYDPNFPVCLQTYGIAGDNIECGYSSQAQCSAAASGRSAQCIINPFFASRQAAGPRSRRQRGVY